MGFSGNTLLTTDSTNDFMGCWGVRMDIICIFLLVLNLMVLIIGCCLRIASMAMVGLIGALVAADALLQ